MPPDSALGREMDAFPASLLIEADTGVVVPWIAVTCMVGLPVQQLMLAHLRPRVKNQITFGRYLLLQLGSIRC